MAKKDYSNWSKEDLVKEVEKKDKLLKKKYGVVWEDKPEKVALLCKEKLPVLIEDKNKEIKADKEKPVNFLIEGDNYHALSVLNYTHKGKVDLIYIDPPYNTGKKKEWKYNDHWVDENDQYRHSKWLSFMQKRLNLAKPLLKTGGVIFISIDDNEYAQLRLLCNEIFTEKNFVANIIWQKKFSPQNDATYFSIMHDYILCIAKKKKKNKKDADGWQRNLLARPDNSSYKNSDNDSRGPWTSGDLTAEGPTPNCIYEIISPTKRRYLPPKGKRWVFNKDNYKLLRKENRIWFGKNGNSFPRLKRFLSEVQKGYVPNTIWFYNEVGHTQEGKQEFNDLFGREIDFDYPKPSRLIERIIEIGANKNALILDFFAGTGTTAQSVLSLNSKDGGKRKFILCTNDENNICTEICYPRIQKVINGYINSKKEKVNGLGGNLKYFKTGFVDAQSTDKNKKRLVDKSTEMLCLKENCFNEAMKGREFKIFTNSQGKNLGIIYDDEGIEPFKKKIKKLKKKFVVYVFSLDESAREEEFEDVAKWVELKPIPAVILNVYKKIFK